MNRLILITFTIVLTAMAGRQKPVTLDDPEILSPGKLTLGQSHQGLPIDCYIFGDGSDVVFLMAAIHGSEPAGTPLLWSMMDHINSNPELIAGRTVIIMPVANPDGLAKRNRHNANGVDLNRNFDTANRVNKLRYGMSALSEPESRIIESVIEQYKPARIVTIHQPLDCIDYDGPAREFATHLGKYTDLPVKKLGASPGSLGSYAGETLQIPTVTFELPKAASYQNPDKLWNKYGQAITAAITYPEGPDPIDMQAAR